jgi:hypothetical protein
LTRRSGDQRLVVIDCGDDLDALVHSAARQDHGIGTLFESHLIERRAHAYSHVTLDFHVNLHEATISSEPENID